MRVYTYHEVPGASALADDPILIKEGFNWIAALFTVFWALWHGLWQVVLVILIAGAALEAVLYLIGADPVAQTAAALGLAAIVGFCANDWRRAALSRRGYRFEGVVAAETADNARRRWFDRYPPGQVLPAPGTQAT